MRAGPQGGGQDRFWLTVWSTCALLPLALGWGSSLAGLWVLAVIGIFVCLQWTGCGSYAQVATRCYGFAWGVLSLVDVGRAYRRSFTSSPLLVAEDVLVQYEGSLPRLALLSLLTALLGLLVVCLAQTSRQLRRQPRWYTTPLAGDPQFRRQFRRAGDASLILSCLLPYVDLCIRHQEAVFSQAAPELWDLWDFFQRAGDASPTFGGLFVYQYLWTFHQYLYQEIVLIQDAPELWALLVARVHLALAYDALIAGWTVGLLLSTSRVAIRTRRHLNQVAGQDAGTDRQRAPPGVT
jgi:hypothetical protein